MGVTVIHSKPDVFDMCEKEFGISWENTVFACFPHIHSKKELSDDVIEHELIHIQQQKDYGGVDGWWDAYFKDPVQRLAWEMEAYRHQYQFLKMKNTMNRNTLFYHVVFWASNLAGKSYGELIGREEAIKQIME